MSSGKVYDLISAMLQNFPAELCQWPNWVAWRYEFAKDAVKPTKVPYSPITGYRASSQLPTDWGSVQQALDFMASANMAGVGFVFTNTPYAGVDFDEINPESEQIVAWLDSYTERSPSNSGLHVIVKGAVQGGKKRNGVEVYSEGRYFTMTGHVEHAKPIREVDLNPLWEWLGGRQQQHESSIDMEQLRTGVFIEDSTILRSAEQAVNSAKFQKLWQGDLSEYNNDHSAADQALINMLVFYTRDLEQVKRLFQQSGLGQRQKAYRKDYLDRTIRKALDQTVPLIELKREPAAVGIQGSVEVPPVPSPAVRSAFKISYPPGLVGDLAQWIYAQAPHPNHTIALMGAIGLFAGLTGRAFSISGKGLNQYIVVLARTGRGKEAIASGISKLFGVIGVTDPNIWNFHGPGEIASGQALIKRLAAPLPSLFCILGEFGHFMQDICSRHAGQNEVKLRRVLLDIYGKSGPTDMVQPMVYSDTTKNTHAIRSPNFTIMGESTPEEFYKATDEDAVAMGLLPRFLLVEFEGERSSFNEGSVGLTPPIELVNNVMGLVQWIYQQNAAGTATPVQLDWDALAVDRQYRHECDERINGEKNNALAELWNRSHMKTLKLAALVAVGVNPSQPIINVEMYRWARALVDEGTFSVMAKFEAGLAGNPVNAVRQNEDAMKVIHHYLGPDYQGSRGVEPEVRAARFVPLHYMRACLRRTGSFRNAPNTNEAIDRTLKALCEDGVLARVEIKTRTGGAAVHYAISSDVKAEQ